MTGCERREITVTTRGFVWEGFPLPTHCQLCKTPGFMCVKKQQTNKGCVTMVWDGANFLNRFFF